MSRLLEMSLLLLGGVVNGAAEVEMLGRGSADELKAVFFSGEPWLIHCISAAVKEEPAELALHAVVRAALPALPSELRVGLLDCGKKLPSGKTTLQRFKLDSSLVPTLVLAANGRPPKQITGSMISKYASSSVLFPTTRQHASALVALVSKAIEPKIVTISKEAHLSSHCLRHLPQSPLLSSLRSRNSSFPNYGPFPTTTPPTT